METVPTFKTSESLLSLIKFRYLPFWPILAVLMVLSAAAAYVYLKITPRIYESSISILIKDEKKGVETPGIQSLDIYSSKKLVENEIEVLGSYALVQSVSDSLNLFVSIVDIGSKTKKDAYSSSPIAIEVFDPKKIGAVEKMDFAYDSLKAEVVVDNKKYAIDKWIDFRFGTIKFIKNPHQKTSTKGPFSMSISDPKRVAADVQQGLSVKPTSKLSTVVILSYQDTDYSRAENILNAMITKYYAISVADKNRLAYNTLKFVEDRIRVVERELDSIENRIQQFRSDKGVINLGDQGKLYLDKVGSNDQRLTDVNLELSILEQVEKYIRDKDASSSIIPATQGIADKSLTQLVEKLYELEMQYNRLKLTTAENNPILLGIQSQITTLRPGILENISSHKKALLASRESLQSVNNQYSSVLQSIPKKEQDLLEINRQQSIKSAAYNFLLQKREETVLSYASGLGDGRTVDTANTSFAFVKPNPKKLMLAAIGLSLLVFVLIIAVKESWTGKILFRTDIETETEVPVLAEISYTKPTETGKRPNWKTYLFQEQLSQLRAGLHTKTGTNPKVIMLTSSASGEGKSYLSSQLATNFARSGKKVVLVDFDFRSPAITREFKLETTPGVSEYLEESVEFNEILNATEVKKLTVIGAGTSDNNATTQLLDGNVEAFIAKLSSEFDYVVIDTPPLGLLSDAAIISKFCDHTLFVLRHGKTPKSLLRHIDGYRETLGINRLSIVFNGVRSRGFGFNQQSYGYGNNYISNYGKGYGQRKALADKN